MSQAANLTERTVVIRSAIESMTDRLSVAPWDALGEVRAARLLELSQKVRVAAGV